MVIADGSSILFTGDSITDAGRMRPVGEDTKGCLGTGYVSVIASILEAWHQEQRYRIRNTGISGHTVLDLQARWKEDVLDLRPDWLSLMVGINDCARAFSRPLLTEIHVPPNVYRTTLDALVGKTRPLVKGIVIMAPFYIDSNLHDELRVALTAYVAAARDVSEKHACVFVDTQAAFDKAMLRTHAIRLSDDRVHPNPTGHLILAKTWLDAVGFCWPTKTAETRP